MTDFKVTTNDASDVKIVHEELPASAPEPSETAAPKGGKK